MGIKSESKISGLSDKTKAASLRKKLSESKLFMVYEIFMVSSNLWAELGALLSQIFLKGTELQFAGLSVQVIGDYLQWTLVRVRFIFSRFTSGSKMNQLLLLQL